MALQVQKTFQKMLENQSTMSFFATVSKNCTKICQSAVASTFQKLIAFFRRVFWAANNVLVFLDAYDNFYRYSKLNRNMLLILLPKVLSSLSVDFELTL